MFKKITAAILSAVMLLSLTACKDNKTVTKDGTELLGDGKYKITDEYTELSFFYPASKAEDGEYEFMKEAAKYTNVYAKPSLPKSMSDFNQAFNLMIASGDMPDIIEHYNDAQFSKLGAEGAFVPLDEYFDIMPNFKKILDENPVIKDRLTYSDGHIYYAPCIPGGKVSTGWVVRQDWMDKLGLEHPKTVDDFYNILKAFKTQDPNGNGKADEVPYFDNFNALLALFDAFPDWYMEDGKAKYGPAQPEFKTAITTLKKWYDEGLLDQEIMTGKGQRDRRLTDNVGGMTHNWFASTFNYNRKLKDQIPGFKLIEMLPPEGVTEREQRDPSYVYGWGVSASSKNLETAIKYVDFWMSDFASVLQCFGVEGVHHDVVDGKPQFKAELLADPEFQQQLGAKKATDIGYKFMIESEQAFADERTPIAWKNYEENVEYQELFPLVDMYLSEEDFEEYTKTYTEIKTYADEMKQKWILGSADITKNYDEYMNQLKKFGLDEMTKMVQKAIDDRK